MASTSPSSRSDRARAYGKAGAFAALLALFLDLLWRVTVAPVGVVTVPEWVVAAVARLTPTAIFGWATETFGSMAQNSLWAVVLLGIVLTGYWAGQMAGAIIDARNDSQNLGSRLLAAALMAIMLFLVIAVVILPLAREGFFAISSGNQIAVLLQAVAFAAIWGLTWALAAAPQPALHTDEHAATAETLSRRTAVGNVAAAGLAAGIAFFGWRLAKAPDTGNAAASEQAAADIAERARLAAPPEAPSLAAAQATPAAAADTEAIFTQLQADGKLTPVITAVADFYHVSKNIADPEVDATSWTLSIGGMVAKPLQFKIGELQERSRTRNITTLSCISNELNGDLAGTAEWTGIPLRELLEEAGVNPATVDIVFRAADGYDDSIPFTVAMSPSTMLVTGMNGAPLPSDHGAPARLIVPPIYGMKNVKWIEQIEAVDLDYKGYWETRGWSDTAHYQIWGRIDTPAAGDELQPGPAVAAGVSAAGNRGILRVEISLDGGDTWGDAELEPSINPNYTWVRWAFPFEAISGSYSMVVRATDGEGTVATNEYRPPLPDGATGWPQRAFRVA